MDRNERAPDSTMAMKMVLAGHQAELWTALPGIIDTFDPQNSTARVQPALQVQVKGRKGELTWVTMPLLLDCPVCFPGGGGFQLTFPIKPGDDCLVVFASRCIDTWWENGGLQQQAELRMHSLSDGFVLVGVRSLPQLPSVQVSPNHVELRADDGDSVIRITSGGRVEVVSDVEVEVTAPTITLNGSVTINGTLDVTGHVIGEGIDLHDHIHSGVDAGGSNSGPPVP